MDQILHLRETLFLTFYHLYIRLINRQTQQRDIWKGQQQFAEQATLLIIRIKGIHQDNHWLVS